MNNKLCVRAHRSAECGLQFKFGGVARRIIAWFLLLWLLPFQHSLQAADVRLEGIDYAALPGNVVQIVLTTSAPVHPPTSFTTDTPARIAMDFPGITSGLKTKVQPIGIGPVDSVTTVAAGGKVRVVVNLRVPVPHDIRVAGNQVFVTVGQSDSAADVSANRPSTVPVTREAAEAPSARSIRDVDFRRGPDGQGRVLLTLPTPATVVDVREQGTRVLLDIRDAELPPRLAQEYDVTDFATPVQKFTIRSAGKDVRVEIKAAGEYEYLAFQTDDLYTVELRPLTKEEKEAIQKKREVFTGERLSLNFQDIEVRAVLQLLADFTGLNLVTSDMVTGRVTLRLKNVPWDQALDIILKTKGLGKRLDGNVMVVAPIEEIAAREKLELESQKQIEELAPLRSEFIQVNYAKAEDFAALLKSEDNPLLTPERGNVSFDARTNTLLVQDTAAKLEEIRRLIAALDIPIRQVLIESRVVIATDDYAKDLGVRFGFNRGNIFNGGDNFAVIAGGLEGHTSGTFGLAPGIENPVDSGSEALLVNLPVANPSGAVNLLVGKLGSFLLQMELSAMQLEGKGEIISSPRVITSDQNTATIKQGVEIPYQSVSQNFGTNVEFKEAVLKLNVTPHITPDDRILMELDITKDSPDFSREINGVPPVDTRSVDTTVLVDNGETVVLGGVFERTTTQNQEKVPFFGDIPYVGFLFKRKEYTDSNRELLIFVTPRILKESLGMR